jgi:hypothetical protein
MAPSVFSFPKSQADFEYVKQLDDVRSDQNSPRMRLASKLLEYGDTSYSLKAVTFFIDTDQFPWRTQGCELTYQFGKSVFLGKRKAGRSFTTGSLNRRVKEIRVSEAVKNSDGNFRSIYFYDETDK